MHHTTMLRNLRIWDGDTVIPADCLRLRDTVIDSVGEGLNGRDSDTVIDCAGATAVPGLTDAHVHLELDPEHSTPPAPATRSRWPHGPGPWSRPVSPRHATSAAACGWNWTCVTA